MRTSGLGLVVSGVLVTMLSSPLGTARADEVVKTCKAGGFVGSIKVTSGDKNGLRSDIHIYYKISKGENSGGNKANIYVSDGGVLPKRDMYSGDKGIQDGKWHYLDGHYARGGGGLSFRFVFDKSKSGDPQCTGSF